MKDSKLQEIKDKINLVEYIGTFLSLKKAGLNYKANCPFHNEKSASFIISPQKQIWHCFGCGLGGDIFGFVTKYENIDFSQAIKILAEKTGVTLDSWNSQNQNHRDESEVLLKINAFTAKLYSEVLKNSNLGKEAFEYLKKRGLSEKTILDWQIGFAPDSFDFLKNNLAKKNISPELAVKAGVLSKSERGLVFDRFKGRITFPIHNFFGEIVGFSARILSEKTDLAKYINSPETPIYNKSKVMFGLYFAKNEIRKKDEVVVVEGQMDCISAHQKGYKNIVATSGTALTESQIREIGRLTKNIKFCFDSDAAGLKAARRAIENFFGMDMVFKIVWLEQAKDPDELLQKNPKLFEEAISTAPLFMDFYLDRSFSDFDSSSVEKKKNIAKDILPLVKSLIDPIEREHYIKKVAERMGVAREVIENTLSKTPKIQTFAGKQVSQDSVKTFPPQNDIMEKQVLGLKLSFPETLLDFEKYFSQEDFQNLQICKLFFDQNQPAVDDLTLAKEASFMVELLYEESSSKEVFKKNAKKIFAQFKLSAIRRREKLLSFEIKRSEKQNKKNEMKKLQQDFILLIQDRIFFEKMV